MELLKKISTPPEKFANFQSSKWVRIHLLSGKSCLGYYSYKDDQWREFNDLQNLHNTSLINIKNIKGWNY
jgi:hypothetical protein